MKLFQTFAHKDQSDNKAPIEVYNWRLLVLALSASSCSGLVGFDSGLGAVLALPSFASKFGLDKLEGHALAQLKSNIVSLFQAGAFWGVFGSYFLNERLGRKKSVMILGVEFMVGVVLQMCASVNGLVGLFYAGRVLTGIAVGFYSASIPLYNSEWAPPAARGFIVALYECCYQVCLCIAFWVSYGVRMHISGTNDLQWHIPIALQFVFCGVSMFLMLFQPESYRWLIKTGKIEEARKHLANVRRLEPQHPYINYEIQCVLEQLEEERKLTNAETLKNSSSWVKRTDTYIRLKELGKKSVRNRLFIGLMTMMLQNLSGINALNYYSPTIFASIGVSGNGVDLLATGVFGIVKAVANIITVLFLLDRWGRRKPLLFGSSITVFTMFYIGAYAQLSGSFDHSVSLDAGGRTALAMIYIFSAMYSISWNAIPFLYCAEIFPINVRNIGMSLCAMNQYLFQFVIVYSNPYMMTDIKYGTFYFFGSCLLVSVPFVYFFLPETKGISLENMDIMFAISGTARTKRRKAQEIIDLRRHEIELHDNGVQIVPSDDENSIEKPTESRTSV